MATDPSIQNLQFDLLLEEQRVLNTMENWATTLFITAIALVVKQLIDWANPTTAPTTLPQIPILNAAYLLPAGIGLVGFAFLRILNFRIRRVRGHQYDLVMKPRTWSGSSGLVGWAMALLPMLTGYVCSLYFVALLHSLAPAFGFLVAIACGSIWYARRIFRRQTLDAQTGSSSSNAA
jgi:hypothetical protein